MKKYFDTILFTLLGTLGFAGVAFALPYYTSQQTILPFTNSSYDLGTTSQAWRNVYFNRICLTADTCRTTWPASSGGSFPFSADTNYGQQVYSTSTPTLWLKSGVFASSTSHFVNLDASNATSTGLYGSVLGTNGEYFTDLTGSGLVNTGGALTCATASGSVFGCLSSSDWTTFNNKGSGTLTAVTGTWPIISSGGTTPNITWGGFASTTALTAGRLLVSDGTNGIFDVATGTVSAGSSAITVTAGRSAVGGALAIDCATASAGQNGCLSSTDFSTFNGKQSALTFTYPLLNTAGTVSTAFGTTTQNNFNAHNTFTSLFATSASSTNATTTNLTVSGNTILSNIISALPLTSSNGTISAYAGTSCTNQFVRSLSALGSATCNSVNLQNDITSTLNVGNGGTGATTLTGLLQGNGSGAITGIGGTIGQFPYYNGSNTLLATSTLYLDTTSNVGIGSTTPFYKLSVGTVGSAYGSIVSTENKLATSTNMTIDWRNGNQQLVQIGSAAVAIGFSNALGGGTLRLTVCNPNGTAGVVTFSGVLWNGGTTPSQTTTANKCDVWSFVSTQSTSTTASFIILGSQTANF